MAKELHTSHNVADTDRNVTATDLDNIEEESIDIFSDIIALIPIDGSTEQGIPVHSRVQQDLSKFLMDLSTRSPRRAMSTIVRTMKNAKDSHGRGELAGDELTSLMGIFGASLQAALSAAERLNKEGLMSTEDLVKLRKNYQEAVASTHEQ
jgi:hypothetical protein